MPYFVYILLSLKDNKLYVGCTENLEHRVKDHIQGKIPATMNRRPLEIIHFEKFESKSEAFNRERFLKSLWSARFKQKILKKYKQNRASH